MAAGEEVRKLVCACGKPLGTFTAERLELYCRYSKETTSRSRPDSRTPWREPTFFCSDRFARILSTSDPAEGSLASLRLRRPRFPVTSASRGVLGMNSRKTDQAQMGPDEEVAPCPSPHSTSIPTYSAPSMR